MRKMLARAVFALLLLSYVIGHFLAPAHASSLGIGTNEAMLPSTGYFASLMNWVNVQQQDFYRALTGSLKSMRDGGGGFWALVGLSFVYGIFHAAGPGHGKAVISSYMLANEVALRRGVMLSFVSAMLQAVTAIVMMLAVFLILRGSSVSMTDATHFLEIASYALITLFGAWLLWKKAWPRLAGLFGRNPAVSLSSATAHPHAHDHDHATCGHGDRGHIRLAHGGGPIAQQTHHHTGEVCSTCGHSHAPDPTLLSGDRFDWRTAWSAVAAVGLRPCSGALIVLTFAFLNGLWLGGVLSVFAMAIGTAITVATLATIAVTAKNWAVAMAGDGRAGNRLHAIIEIGGAALVFLLGLLLLTASLND
ncbi:MAG: nickel/cobalt transporter [Rhizobiaceae bacterium]|nr:nickel/cobalt transporter [Rhizobiaceae bacterium]